MNAVWLVVIGILTLWGLGILGFLVLDGLDRKRYRLTLELRDWQEKVEAMRRMQEEDGEA